MKIFFGLRTKKVCKGSVKNLRPSCILIFCLFFYTFIYTGFYILTSFSIYFIAKCPLQFTQALTVFCWTLTTSCLFQLSTSVTAGHLLHFFQIGQKGKDNSFYPARRPIYKMVWFRLNWLNVPAQAYNHINTSTMFAFL